MNIHVNPALLRRRVMGRVALLATSLRAIARAQSVNMSTVMRWLNTGHLTPRAVKVLCTSLGVSTEWLKSTSMSDVGAGLDVLLKAEA